MQTRPKSDFAAELYQTAYSRTLRSESKKPKSFDGSIFDLTEESIQANRRDSTSTAVTPLPENKYENVPSEGLICIYPVDQNGPSPISIRYEDFAHLAPGQFLNDVILEFYLKYTWNELIPDAKKEDIHLFSSYFYEQLTNVKKKTGSSSKKDTSTSTDGNKEKEPKYGIAYDKIRKWTKHVDIFQKRFLVIPINEQYVLVLFILIIQYALVLGDYP
jgi:Ulp1 family protease